MKDGWIPPANRVVARTRKRLVLIGGTVIPMNAHFLVARRYSVRTLNGTEERFELADEMGRVVVSVCEPGAVELEGE